MTDKYNNIKIAVIGGDLRMLHCGRYLSEFGFETALYGFDNCCDNIGGCTKCASFEDAVKNSNIIILPLPVSCDGITLNMPLSETAVTLPSLFSLIDKDSVLLAGNVSKEIQSLSQKFGLTIVDYFDREELKIANAVLTAESAVEIAMTETDRSITSEPVLVVGYGRIGKALCRLLKSFGCNVYASARKCSDKAWIRAFGYSDIDTADSGKIVSQCKSIFNTVPFMVLDEEVLSLVSKDCLIIDLASKPGGVDFEKAKGENLRVIWALALPGKKLKISAGKAISDTIINILEEGDII